MAEIRDVFFQECEEQLGELESGLLRMQDGTTDAETVNAVFRAVHSIKGGAGIFALDGLVRFAHVFETSLDAIRSGKMQAGPHVMALLLRAADVLMDLVRAARKNETVPESRTQGLVAEFKDLAAGGGAKPAAAAASAAPPPPPPPAPEAQKRTWIVRLTPKAALYIKANETALLLRELMRLGEAEVEIDTSELPSLADLDPEGAYLSWTVTLTTDRDAKAVREVFDFVEDVTSTSSSSPISTSSAGIRRPSSRRQWRPRRLIRLRPVCRSRSRRRRRARPRRPRCRIPWMSWRRRPRPPPP
jgi:two-component system chemotaxis sensor kinase CheA